MLNKFVSKFGKNNFDFLTKNIREEFNRDVLNATYKAQKRFGFEIGSGKDATWKEIKDKRLYKNMEKERLRDEDRVF